MWRMDFEGGQPQFFDDPIAAVAAVPDLGAFHVVWFDSFDYELHNRGRVA